MPRIQVVHVLTSTPQPVQSPAVMPLIASLVALQPRATDDPSSTSSANPSTTTSVSTQDEDEKDTIAKPLLEYAILAVALVIIACFVIRRISRLKGQHLTISRIFGLTGTEPTSPTRAPTLPRVHDDRRVRALDITDGGRRVGTNRARDHDEYSEKDILPAYENTGGPPTYAELDTSGRSGEGPALHMETTSTQQMQEGSGAREPTTRSSESTPDTNVRGDATPVAVTVNGGEVSAVARLHSGPLSSENLWSAIPAVGSTIPAARDEVG